MARFWAGWQFARQPGDGHCCYHALAAVARLSGFDTGATAAGIRQGLAAYFENNPNFVVTSEVSVMSPGLPASRVPVQTVGWRTPDYAEQVRDSLQGGIPEIAAFAAATGVNLASAQFTAQGLRLRYFGSGTPAVMLQYTPGARGGGHYNLLFHPVLLRRWGVQCSRCGGGDDPVPNRMAFDMQQNGEVQNDRFDRGGAGEVSFAALERLLFTNCSSVSDELKALIHAVWRAERAVDALAWVWAVRRGPRRWLRPHLMCMPALRWCVPLSPAQLIETVEAIDHWLRCRAADGWRLALTCRRCWRPVVMEQVLSLHARMAAVRVDLASYGYVAEDNDFCVFAVQAATPVIAACLAAAPNAATRRRRQ